MKLFGKYSEYTINDICLYATPMHEIQRLMKRPGTETIVKEYRPKKYKKIIKDENGVPVQEREYVPDKSLRHQVVAIQDLGFAKISIYSTATNTKEVKLLGLEPIEQITKKEKMELTMEKLSDKPSQRGPNVQISEIVNGVVLPQ